MVPGSTLLGTRLNLATQPCYEASSNLEVGIVQNAAVNIGLARLSLWEWPEVYRETAK